MEALTKKQQRTIIVVGASTAVGFLGDVLTFSVAASRGGSFKVVMPKGKELVTVLLLGVVGGFAIDLVLKYIEEALKNEEEKILDKVIALEKERIYTGAVLGKKPSVLWA